MTEITITLSPSGGIRLHIPDGRRTLDIPVVFSERVECTCCGERYTAQIEAQPLRTIKRILKGAAEHREGHDQRGHIGAFPTQAVIDAWKAEDERKKAVDLKAKYAAKGIDLDKMGFEL